MGYRQRKRGSQNSNLAKTLIYGIDVYSIKGNGFFFKWHKVFNCSFILVLSLPLNNIEIKGFHLLTMKENHKEATKDMDLGLGGGFVY